MVGKRVKKQISSSDDEAPEAVSFSGARDSAILRKASERQANEHQEGVEKARRRGRDTLLKEQAQRRKERLEELLASVPGGEKRAQGVKRSLHAVKPTKKIFKEEEEDEAAIEEKITRTGSKVVLLGDQRIIKVNARAAAKVQTQRKQLEGLRDAKSVGLDSRMAHTRVGRVATKFISSQADREELRARLKAMLPKRPEKKKRESALF